jgi:Kdo2-lipid IVA lauroyltransferase/acyltransferase
MSKILYYLVIIPLSKLPFGALYLLSDFLFVIIYHIVKYRRKVVIKNLKNSFPEKSDQEWLEIERRYYRHLCDLVVESLKGFSITEHEVKQRMVIRNPQVVDQFFDRSKNVAIVGGHYGNWEMYAFAADSKIKHQAVALYTPLKDKFLNEKITKSRSRFGLKMLSILEIRANLAAVKPKLTATIFGSDQAPKKTQRAYWMTFLNQETAVQFGTEKFTKEYNMPVVYGTIYKMKRGHYEVEFTLICADPHSMGYGEITQQHTKMLEQNILEKPEYWLWSHKRWKRSRPEGEHLYAPGKFEVFEGSGL